MVSCAAPPRRVEGGQHTRGSPLLPRDRWAPQESSWHHGRGERPSISSRAGGGHSSGQH